MKSFLSLLVAVPIVLAAGPKINRKQTAQSIPGVYIAGLNQNARLDTVTASVEAQGVRRKYTYEIGDWKGIAFYADDKALDKLATVDGIENIEPDGLVHAQTLTTQNPAGQYGLASISHRMKHQNDYIYDETAGQGVGIYIVDSGIYTGHVDFENRARKGPRFCSDDSGPNPGGLPCDMKNSTDGNGHGTFCAGVAASKTYGVAKKANLIGVKVLSDQGLGAFSDIIAGIQWSVNDAKNSSGRAVLNLSLGGGLHQNVNDAVAAAVKAGVFVACAAGNDNTGDIDMYSPASEPLCCTVGSVDFDWTKAQSSNYGPGVDVYASGVNITSTWINLTDATTMDSGTSFSAPHVAGLAAYLIALQGQNAPAADRLCAQIQQLSTKGMIGGLPNTSNNYMAYNGVEYEMGQSGMKGASPHNMMGVSQPNMKGSSKVLKSNGKSGRPK